MQSLDNRQNIKKMEGIAGSTGRLLAHYAGAAVNPKQTLMQGRDYHVPMSNLDIDRIGGENINSTEIQGYKLMKDKDENIKKEERKNNLPSDSGLGERQVE